MPVRQKLLGKYARGSKPSIFRFRSKLDIAVEPFFIGHIPAFWISAPGVSKDHTILFFHGGGFMVGSTDDHLDLCGKLSRSAGCRVLSIDYRLAPEHIFPAALDDCIASYLWLIETGTSPSLIVPVGISAGGNLHPLHVHETSRHRYSPSQSRRLYISCCRHDIPGRSF